jgi:hypothetical protein
MKRLALTLLLPASMLLIGSAEARSVPETIAKLAKASVTAPPEWTASGRLSTRSIPARACSRARASARTPFVVGRIRRGPPGTGIELHCTGNADATTIDVTCTGSGPAFAGCVMPSTRQIHGTRSDDTYFNVTTINITSWGQGALGATAMYPDQFPWHPRSQAHRTSRNAHEEVSWGEIKVLYR